MKSRVWAVVGLGVGAVGCAQGSTTGGRAFVHPTFPYAVTYDDEKTQSVLGDDWRLENYRRNQASTNIQRKDGYELKSCACSTRRTR